MFHLSKKENGRKVTEATEAVEKKDCQGRRDQNAQLIARSIIRREKERTRRQEDSEEEDVCEFDNRKEIRTKKYPSGQVKTRNAIRH